MTTRSKKSGKSQKNDKLKEFYADDMMDEEAVQDNRQRPRNALIEEDEDDELENVNLEAELSKQKDKKINMDRISDILVNMIFKNVSSKISLIYDARKSIPRMHLKSLSLMSKT